jgi:hypothetical protein
MPPDNPGSLKPRAVLRAWCLLLLVLLLVLCIVALLPHTTEAATTLLKPPNNLGLVGYWSLNEGTGTIATDFSGNGNKGTLTDNGSGIAAWTNGKRGKALDFNGDQTVAMASHASLAITGDVTICAWVKADAFVADESDAIFGRANSGGVTQYLLSTAEDLGTTQKPLAFTWSNTAGTEFEVWATTAEISTGVWYHLCGMRNSDGDGDIFINGQIQSVTSIEDEATPPTVSAQAAIGGFGEIDCCYWDGIIDEVRIYSRALSASEIAKLYASGLVKANASSANLDNGSSLERGLVGHWTFDGADVQTTVADRSSSNKPGYFVGGATSSAKTIGKLGQALSFDNVNDLIRVADTTASPLDITGDFAIAAWVRRNVAGGYDGILAKTDSDELIDFAVWLCGTGSSCTSGGHTNKLMFYSDDPSGASLNSTGTIADTNWYHVVVTRSGTTVTFYIDGASSGTATLNGALSTSNNPVIIGADYAGAAAAFFNGLIDDVRIYNRTLSSTEVKQLSQLGTVRISQ